MFISQVVCVSCNDSLTETLFLLTRQHEQKSQFKAEPCMKESGTSSEPNALEENDTSNIELLIFIQHLFNGAAL